MTATTALFLTVLVLMVTGGIVFGWRLADTSHMIDRLIEAHEHDETVADAADMSETGDEQQGRL